MARAAIAAGADLVLVLGGDGSMLNAARNLAQYRVPLVGVNQGRLGFMTDIAAGNMFPAMQRILAGEFGIEERTLLDTELTRDGDRMFNTLALNDVVLHVHDEIVLEVPEKDAEAAAQTLHNVMCTPPIWANGLPLEAEVQTMKRYGK